MSHFCLFFFSFDLFPFVPQRDACSPHNSSVFPPNSWSPLFFPSYVFLLSPTPSFYPKVVNSSLFLFPDNPFSNPSSPLPINALSCFPGVTSKGVPIFSLSPPPLDVVPPPTIVVVASVFFLFYFSRRLGVFSPLPFSGHPRRVDNLSFFRLRHCIRFQCFPFPPVLSVGLRLFLPFFPWEMVPCSLFYCFFCSFFFSALARPLSQYLSRPVVL